MTKEDIANEDLQYFDDSFYHPLSVKLFNKVADIICTNRPWSLCWEFYEVLFDSGEKFLVISNSRIVLNISYSNNQIDGKEVNIISKIKNKELWVYKRVENFQQLKDRRTGKKIPFKISSAWFINLPFERKSYLKHKPIQLKNIQEKYNFIDDDGDLCFNGVIRQAIMTKHLQFLSRHCKMAFLKLCYEVVVNKKLIFLKPLKNFQMIYLLKCWRFRGLILWEK